MRQRCAVEFCPMTGRVVPHNDGQPPDPVRVIDLPDGGKLNVIVHMRGPYGIEGYCVDPMTGRTIAGFVLRYDGPDDDASIDAAVMAADPLDLTGRTAVERPSRTDPRDTLIAQMARAMAEMQARLEALEGRGGETLEKTRFLSSFLEDEQLPHEANIEETAQRLSAEYVELLNANQDNPTMQEKARFRVLTANRTKV